MDTTYYTSDGCAYTGMTQETIIRLREELGRETIFVSEDEYYAIRALQDSASGR